MQLRCVFSPMEIGQSSNFCRLDKTHKQSCRNGITSTSSQRHTHKVSENLVLLVPLSNTNEYSQLLSQWRLLTHNVGSEEEEDGSTTQPPPLVFSSEFPPVPYLFTMLTPWTPPPPEGDHLAQLPLLSPLPANSFLNPLPFLQGISPDTPLPSNAHSSLSLPPCLRKSTTD